MVDLAAVIKFLTSGLAIKNSLNTLFEWRKKIHTLSQEQFFEDINELSKFFFKGSVPYGTVVNLEGIFSEFGHTYFPYTYSPVFPGDVKHRRISIDQGQLEWKYKVFQPPVEILPSFEFEGKTCRLGFVYPKNFKGFVYEAAFENTTEAMLANKPYLHIPDEAMPIPIIYNTKFAVPSGYSCVIKAKVIELPFATQENLFVNWSKFSSEVYKKSFDWYNPDKKSLCLLVDEEPLGIKREDIYSIEKFPLTFFVETHISNPLEEVPMKQLLNESIPNLADKNAPIASAGNSQDPGHSTYLTNGNVKIFFRRPSIIGFYAHFDLSESQEYRSHIEELSQVIRLFSRNIQNNSFEMIGERLKLHTDFVSDKRLIKQMNLQRVLESNEIQKVIESNPEYESIRRWLVD